MLSCAADLGPVDTTPEPVELTEFGAHVAMGIADGVSVCGRSSEYADQFVALYLESSADGPLSADIEYYVLTPEEVGSLQLCGPDSSACALDGVVYASSPVVLHELVHAARRLQPDARRGLGVLEEGIAQLHFTYEFSWDETFRPSRLPDFLDGERPSQLYDPAAQLLDIVARETDFATAEALVDASADAQDAESLAAIVEDVVGLDLATLDELYAETPRCSPTERSRMLVACAGEALPWQSGAGAPYVEVAARPLACRDGDVFGPFDGRLWLEHAIEIQSDGAYELSVDVAPGQRLQLVSCDHGCEGGVDVDWDDAARTQDIDMDAGRYVLRLSRALEDSNAVGVRLSSPS